MMLKSRRGVVAETILYYVLAGVILFFVPNPISNAVWSRGVVMKTHVLYCSCCVGYTI